MENDKEILIKALRIEGISQDKMVFEKYPTFVMENGHKILGFFTIKAEWVLHCCSFVLIILLKTLMVSINFKKRRQYAS